MSELEDAPPEHVWQMFKQYSREWDKDLDPAAIHSAKDACDAALARLERLVRLAGEWDEHLEHRDFVDEARPLYCASCHKTRCSLEAEIAEAVK